eukprot:2526383-Prymnesium_polylepis.1
MRPVLPTLFLCHAQPVPHGRCPLPASSQRATGVLGPAVVHPHADPALVEEIAKEEHLRRGGAQTHSPGSAQEAGRPVVNCTLWSAALDHRAARRWHLPLLWHHLEVRAREQRVSALVRDRAIGQARRHARTQRVRAAVALTVAVWTVLIAVVLVVDRIDRLLPFAVVHVVAYRLAREGKLAPCHP